MSFRWNGNKVKRKARRAAKDAINETIAEAVRHAKQNHPGWKNRTGTAEGSIRVIEFAHREGNRTVGLWGSIGVDYGLWGSIGVDYMIWLELKHGAALRSAGDATYPKLADHIRRAMP